MKSIVQLDKRCYKSGTTYGLELHHIFFGTANRKLSDKYGLTVWLTPFWHRDGKNGVHFNKRFDLELKQVGQRIFEQNHTREEFVKIFGRNYL